MTPTRLALPATVTLRATYVARESVSLPAFLGGTLHGALGHALHAIDPRLDSLIQGGTPPPEAPGFVRASPPSPVVVVPPRLAEPRTLLAGEPLELGLVLIGPAVVDVGVVLAALQGVGERGLGRGRGRLQLVEVRDDVGQRVWAGGRVRSAPGLDRAAVLSSGGAVTMRPRTPLQILRGGRVVSEPTPADLVGAAARRCVALAWTFGAGLELSVRDLESAARDQLDGRGEWTRLEATRWSSRQQQRHPVGGVMGAIRITGDLEPFMPFLGACVRVGLGKGTALGLGLFDLTVGL